MMKNNFVIATLFSLCVISSHCFECGNRVLEKSHPLIVGGEPSYAGQWPWMASLHIKNEITNEMRYFCGATLVTTTVLITAAHCINATLDYKIIAMLGQFNLSDTSDDNSITRDINRRIVHKDYDELNKNRKNSDADIAILELEFPVEFSNYIRPICLPQQNQNVENVNGFVAGYGQTGADLATTTIPFSLRMKSIDLLKCLLVQKNSHVVLSNRTFCARSHEGIPCKGDSGSGFVSLIDNRWTLLGIVSFAFNTDCNLKDQISLVKVPNFLEWIENLKESLNGEKQVDGDSIDYFLENQKQFVTKLNHLVVDNVEGQIYVGAVNNLYQLTLDFEIKAFARTGPMLDAPECAPSDCPSSVNRHLTDSINKVLLIDYQGSRVIACGTLFQGTCTVRSMQNISIIDQEVQEAVVANTEDASTVAFIAPGPPAPPSTMVMNVGVTFVNSSPYRGEIPAVATRSLQKERMLQIATSHVTTGSRMFINTFARESYPIKYVYGFSSERFSYFLTFQMKHTHGSNEWISKLVRLCQEDSNYYSYTEIPMECLGEDGTNYNSVQAAYVGKPGHDLAESLNVKTSDDVLFAVFNKVKGYYNTKKTAMCVYSLKSIRQKFLQNIKACFNGDGSRGLDFISPTMKCVITRVPSSKLSEDFCGVDINTPLGGEIPVTATTAATFNTELTSIAVTTTSTFTVALIGTKQGHLKKLVIENAKTAIEYADILIDEGSPVNADMFFDKKEINIFVMTEKKISKVRVQNCSMYKTCAECLNARDPYCGWCSMKNNCTLMEECQDAEANTRFWVNNQNGKCPSITSVTPHQAPVAATVDLKVFIEYLPNLEHLVCSFSIKERIIISNTTRNGDVISCSTPDSEFLPASKLKKDHFVARLSVRTASGPNIVSTNFTFFNCSTHLSCTTCVSSLFPCSWCVDNHRCTHDSAENCHNDIIVSGLNDRKPTTRSGPAFCPAINVTDLGTEILIPSGVKRSVKVRVHVIGHSIVQTRYECQFNIEGRVSSVNAQLLGDTIYCDPMEFIYTSKPAHITAPFSVIWDGDRPLDNPHSVNVVIYRCRKMADSCGMCHTLPSKYMCGWCSSSNTCEVEEQCKTEGTEDWLNRMQTCRNPEIHSFSPKTGPWEGGTNITITGINLGKNFSDINMGVRVAGINCVPYKELYISTKQIVCKVDRLESMAHRAGEIVVQVQHFEGESRGDYEFVDPVIHDFEPKFGPMSGGTRIHIRGKHLNAGSLIRASIDGIECNIITTDVKDAYCRTLPSISRTKGILKMEFDSGERSLNDVTFEYVEDPIIFFATSGIDNDRFLKGIPSGGIKVSVYGKNFNSIQSPSMYVYYRNRMFSSPCVITKNDFMTCDSPAIEMDLPMPNGDNSIEILSGPELEKWNSGDFSLHLEYGFLMDSVMATQNLSAILDQPFQLFPDPVYYEFNEKKFYSEYLVINGKNLDRACKYSDVTVMIGSQICNITSLSRHQLICRSPQEELDDMSVMVKIGKNLEFPIGNIKGQTSVLNAILIFVAITISIIILIILLFAFKRCKRNPNTRQHAGKGLNIENQNYGLKMSDMIKHRKLPVPQEESFEITNNRKRQSDHIYEELDHLYANDSFDDRLKKENNSNRKETDED